MQISLSPNTEADDVWRAARTLGTFWTWRDQQFVTTAQEKLTRYLGQPVVLTSSGRAALAAVLRAYAIGAGDEVIIQAFTCVAVPAAVAWTGAKPVFADIEVEGYNLNPQSVIARLTPRTKAIIVQHTFGVPANWAALQSIANEHNVLLIEDAAHALGAKYQGRYIGTLADAAIFSFGRDKIVSSVFGGAVTSKNPLVLARVANEQRGLPLPPAWWIVQQLLHPLLMSVIKPTYFIAYFGKGLLVVAQKLGVLSRAVEIRERDLQQPRHTQWRFSPALGSLLSWQLDKLPRFTAVRRTHAAHYQQAGLPAPRVGGSGEPAWLRYPLRVANPAQLLQKARAHQLLLGDWYQQPVFPVNHASALYHPGDCPVAAAAAQSTINLPTMPTMSLAARERVVAFLKREHII